MHRRALLQPLTTDIAEFALDMRWLGPTVSDWILDETWCDARAWRDYVGNAFLVHDEVARWKKSKFTFSLCLLHSQFFFSMSEQNLFVFSSKLPTNFPLSVSNRVDASRRGKLSLLKY